MATIQELQKKVDILEKGLKNKAVKADAKAKAKIQISKLKEQIADMKKKQTAKGGKKYTKVLSKIKKQTGGTSKKQDGERPAKPVGKRVSSTGNTYYETRANRSDVRQPSKRVPVGQRFADGGETYADGGRITKGAKYMAKFNTSRGDSGYSIYKIVDTDYFSNKYGGSPHTIRYEVIESSHEKVGSFDESSRKDIQTQLKYGMWTKLDKFADGGETYENGGKVKTYRLVPMISSGVSGFITPSYESIVNFTGTQDDAFEKARELVNSDPRFLRVETKLPMKTKTVTVGISERKMADGGAITNIGGTLFSSEDLSGMFENGGELHRTMGNQYGLGGEISDGFTIVSLKESLNKMLPYSFGFKVFPLKRGTSSSADYDNVKSALYGLDDSDIKQKLYFPNYKRDHEINFTIHQGDENTYFDFLLMAEDGNYYVGTFGFKDRGDVSSDYITKFLAFLMEAYGLPFRVNHEIYAQGGMTEHGLRKGDTILDKSMFSNDKVVVRDDDGNYAVVDLDKGERYEDKNK